jgi:L-lactate permease
LAVAGVAYALGAATTTAFTAPADVVTALPIVVLVVLVVVCWPLRPQPRLRPGPGEGFPVRTPEGTGGTGGPGRTGGPGAVVTAHPWRAWVLLTVVVVAWEVAEYAARGSRADHPTLSSMLDAVDRSYGLKALVFFLWLWLGAAMVRRGRDRGRGPRPAQPEPS